MKKWLGFFVLYSLIDDHFQEVQLSEAVNWFRVFTIFPEAYVGQAYYHELVGGVDFWDPQGNPIESLSVLELVNLCSWRSLEKTSTEKCVWILRRTRTLLTLSRLRKVIRLGSSLF